MTFSPFLFQSFCSHLSEKRQPLLTPLCSDLFAVVVVAVVAVVVVVVGSMKKSTTFTVA